MHYNLELPVCLAGDASAYNHIRAKDSIPSLAAARLQSWALLLAGYSYIIKFKPNRVHSNPDCLSRLPLKDCPGLPA